MTHVLAASRCLDDGYYFVSADALGYLDTDRDHRAKELLKNAAKRHIRTYGSIETDVHEIGRRLLDHYRGVLRDVGYPVLRFEEMMGYTDALSEVEVHGHRGDGDRGDGPRGADPTRWMRERSRSRDGGSREDGSYSYEEVSVETSHTVEFAFNENASRSRDDSQNEESQNESDEDRLERYRQSTLSEVCDPDYWMSIHHHEEDDEAERDYEVEVEGEPPEFYRGRAVFRGFNNEPEGEPHGVL